MSPLGGRPPPSLKARAVALLAQRDHSRSELRRKLLPHARAACNAGPEAADADDAGPCLDKLLDWLQAHGHLSEARFVEARVHARASRFGNLRIRQELARHGVELDPGTARALGESELDRARGVWRRKFDGLAQDAAERARQMRFLAGRGFSADVIRCVVQAREDD